MHETIKISIVNQKGGVAKTTTAVNLAAALAKRGKRVLVVDLDPQRNASTTLNRGEQYNGYGINELLYFTVAHLPFSLEEFIRYNEIEDVYYIPATPMLASAPNTLAQDKDSYMVLRKLLGHKEIDGVYDFVIIDCKPSLDLLVGNSLVASDKVIIPVQPDDYSLDGLGDLQDTIRDVQDRYNENLVIDGILITMAKQTRKVTRQLIAALQDMFGEQVYKTIIPDKADAGNAKEKGRSMVNCGSDVGKLYEQLAEEVLSH